MGESRDLMAFAPDVLMRRLFRDFDRFFDVRGPSFFHRPFRKEFGEFAWAPELELTERDHHLFARIDLPGMKKEEISVTFGDGGVTVAGERKKEFEDKKSDWFKTEKYYGSFSRSIPLPEGVNADDIKATFANGVLELKMPLPARLGNAPAKIAIGEGTSEKKGVTKAA